MRNICIIVNINFMVVLWTEINKTTGGNVVESM